ncbi:hypothetical protein TIFTF001_053971 [Ficus carica]|uniref:Uncharacterized protein n=1 Tax=Ficus carica TaxID=3494 RepID=A0AA88EPQ9_FICCA|nr:hypothetical protein TIFTF001_053971 [Ficus carica]
MERLGGWKRDFKVPQAILRWLGTMAVVVGYFCRTDQVATAVSVAKGSHLGLWWTYSVCSAFYEHPSELSNFEEFRDFIFRLPEFSIW